MENLFGLNSDRISNLPDNIMEKILASLPIKDAVRTSVLSTKWRYKWASIPELVFVEEYNLHNLVAFIDRALLVHTGPIQKFELYARRLQPCPNIESWLLALSKKYIKRLKLVFSDENQDYYKVPTSVFSSQTLSFLFLMHCILEPPPTFEGFKNIKSLHLIDISLFNEEIFESVICNCPSLEELSLFIAAKQEHFQIPSSLFSFQLLTCLALVRCILTPPATIKGLRKLKSLHLEDTFFPSEEIFEYMISNCPVLEDLSLVNINNPTRFKICGQNLKVFNLEGYFEDICFLDVPHLVNVFINLSYFSSDKQFDHTRTSFPMINILCCLPGIMELAMYGYFLQFFTMVDLTRCFHLPMLYNLRRLSLGVNFEDAHEIGVTMWLLKGAPNLQLLEIDAGSEIYIGIHFLGRSFWEEQSQVGFPMNHLKMVKINDIVGAHNELEFIKYLLAKSPSLEVLRLTPSSKSNFNEKMVLKELLGFQRASANAKIQYYG